jgi:hypothetical protein
MTVGDLVKRVLVWRSLDIALRRNAPSTVSLADRSANYYAVYLQALDRSNAFMAEEILEEGIGGRWWSDAEARFADPCCVPYRWLHRYHLDIRYLYAGWSFHITGSKRFLWYHLISYAFFKVRLSHFSQIVFNRLTLRRYDRMKVLSHMLERTLEDREYQTANTQLLTDFYSVRWVQRPDKLELERYYKMLLESLEQTGDVAKSELGYRLASKAINTVSEYELEERRHRDNYLVQRGILFLTSALTLIGVAQVYVAFIKD